jgi:hypothetical protein
MSNPNPNLSNLTRAGMGQPRKGHKAISLYFTPELIDKINAVASQQGWKKNYVAEQYLRGSLGLPTDYTVDELDLIAHGTPID